MTFCRAGVAVTSQTRTVPSRNPAASSRPAASHGHPRPGQVGALTAGQVPHVDPTPGPGGGDGLAVGAEGGAGKGPGHGPVVSGVAGRPVVDPHVSVAGCG